MTYICGVDEAGRGPLCGPVFASAVILDNDLKINNLDDSKKIESKFNKLHKNLKKNTSSLIFKIIKPYLK